MLPFVIAAAIAQLAPPAPSLLRRYHFDQPPAWRVQLPRDLRDASGLALWGDRVVVQRDRDAELALVNPESGRVEGRVTLAAGGEGTGTGGQRFEAVASWGDRLVLLRSDGDLFIGRPGADGSTSAMTHRRTGLGGTCDFQAMVVSDAADEALLVCAALPDGTSPEDKDVYRVSLREDDAEPATLAFRIDGALLRQVTGLARFTPSDATLIGPSGHLLLLAAREHAIAELDGAGVPIAGARLPRRRHPRAEGLLLLPDGTLLVADEGGRGSATLAAYQPALAR